ncbi:FAD-dependent monooxygenase [Streptomyces sp. NPDC049099]|uniref:FAD-dependent monooxygenase n=1 Tax=unclassified Streptomyces TaxID=2593676 RepID=UPI0034416B4E
MPTDSADPEVLVAGAGPTGLLLAGDLAASGVRVRILEKRGRKASNLTRSFTVHARTLEQLDARGLAEGVIATGTALPTLPLFGDLDIDFTHLPTRYPYVLITPQFQVERALEERAAGLGVEIEYEAEVVGLRQDAGGVDLEVRTEGGGTAVRRARYAVGTDGVRSRVRELLGIPFPGDSVLRSVILGDVLMREAPANLLTVDANAHGFAFVCPFGDGYYRVLAWNRHNEQSAEAAADFEELRRLTRDILGTDFGMHDPRWVSRFHSDERQATRYRDGRVFLAGDAAHVHSPAGGMGMNTGLQDAMNLAWKLAAAVHGYGDDTLLDSYQAETHPVGEAVLRTSGSLVRAAIAQSGRTRAAQQFMLWLTGHLGFLGRSLGRREGRAISGTGISYSRPRGSHRLVGQFCRNLPADPSVHQALGSGRFVLLTGDDRVTGGELADWADRVIPARPSAAAEHPGTTILVRPDGYIAWAAERPEPSEVRAALQRWAGPAGPLRTPLGAATGA